MTKKANFVSQKEKLYREWKELQIKLGEDLTLEQIDERVQAGNHLQWTIKEMKQLIEHSKKKLADNEFANRNNKFLTETEEGIQFKKERELLSHQYTKEIEERWINFDNWVKKSVENMVGVNWTANATDTRVEIGLANTDPSRKFIFEFGHSFDINYSSYGKSFSANYGSMGSFELLTDDKRRVTYLTGMAKILSDNLFLTALNFKMEENYRIYTELREKIRKIDYELAHAVEVYENTVH